jgi:hypothetical protein
VLVGCSRIADSFWLIVALVQAFSLSKN